jgi:hypothetical protein
MATYGLAWILHGFERTTTDCKYLRAQTRPVFTFDVWTSRKTKLMRYCTMLDNFYCCITVIISALNPVDVQQAIWIRIIPRKYSNQTNYRPGV